MDTFYLQAAFGHEDNVCGMKYFGCHVWCHPPGDHDTKFKSNSCKGIFLGFLLNTTKKIYYYYEESNHINKVSHFVFDEGFNNLPLEKQTPNVIALCNELDDKPFPIDNPSYLTSEDFYFYFHTPFTHTDMYTINIKCDDSTFSILVSEDTKSTTMHMFLILPSPITPVFLFILNLLLLLYRGTLIN